jgi:hypothetical protein
MLAKQALPIQSLLQSILLQLLEIESHEPSAPAGRSQPPKQLGLQVWAISSLFCFLLLLLKFSSNNKAEFEVEEIVLIQIIYFAMSPTTSCILSHGVILVFMYARNQDWFDLSGQKMTRVE